MKKVVTVLVDSLVVLIVEGFIKSKLPQKLFLMQDGVLICI